MKIAVLSDIHGNKLALDSVLADALNSGVQKFFILGDLAMGGYDPNYTIEKVFSLENAEIIQGNTDKLIVNYSEELFNSMYLKNPLMASALKLDSEEISNENKKLLSGLPVNKYTEVQGIKIQLVHGSPQSQEENIFPDTPLSDVERAAAKSAADIIFCGHTHIPCGFSLNSGKTLINVGSVGRSATEDKTPVYLIMSVNSDGSFSFEHRKVKYDNKKVAEIISKRNFKHNLEFAKLYL